MKLKYLKIMTILLGLFCSPRLLMSQQTIESVKTAPIMQSTYYDAISLYYAMAGYRAYPLYIGQVSKQAKVAVIQEITADSETQVNTTSRNTGPGGPAAKTTQKKRRRQWLQAIRKKWTRLM